MSGTLIDGDKCRVVMWCLRVQSSSGVSPLSRSGWQHASNKSRCHVLNCTASCVSKEVSFFRMLLSVLYECKPKGYFTMRCIYIYIYIYIYTYAYIQNNRNDIYMYIYFNLCILRQKMVRQKCLDRMAAGIFVIFPPINFSYMQFWFVTVVNSYRKLLPFSKDSGRVPVLWRCPAFCSR
jgi:hypothetical protein